MNMAHLAQYIPVNMFKVCWITSNNPAQMQEFLRVKASNIAFDKDGNQVYLAESPFLLNMAKQNYADITFHTTSEFKLQNEQATK
jgi:peptide chain release factor 3